MFRRELALTIAPAALAAAILTGAPAQATVADPCGDVTYTVTPNEAGTPTVSDDGHTVAIGVTTRTLTFDVQATNESCDEWEIFIGGSAAASIGHPTWFRPTVKIAAASLNDSQAGANYPLLVRVRESGGNWVNNADSIVFKRATTFGHTFNASPEPIIDGGTLNFTGRIYKASWNDQAYHRYAGRVVSLVRNDSVLAQTMQGDSTALFTGHRVVHHSAVWRAYYFGNATSGSSRSRGDFAQVNVVDED